MATSINASLSISFSVQKSVSNSDPTASSPSLQLNLKAPSVTWNASTTPNGLDAWSGHVVLTSGAATIDLTNLTQSGLSTVINATGNKLRAIMVMPDSTNVNPISVATGASNGYPSIGTVSVLNAGDVLVRRTTQSVAVSSSLKTLDFAGTGAQGCEVLLVFGS